MSLSLYVDSERSQQPSLDLSNGNAVILFQVLFNETLESHDCARKFADELEEALDAFVPGSLIEAGMDQWLEEICIQELTAYLEEMQTLDVPLAWS
jgi:hypothetical protein